MRKYGTTWMVPRWYLRPESPWMFVPTALHVLSGPMTGFYAENSCLKQCLRQLGASASCPELPSIYQNRVSMISYWKDVFLYRALVGSTHEWLCYMNNIIWQAQQHLVMISYLCCILPYLRALLRSASTPSTHKRLVLTNDPTKAQRRRRHPLPADGTFTWTPSAPWNLQQSHRWPI